MKLSEIQPRTMFLVVSGLLWAVFSASWLSDVATYSADMAVPVKVTESKSYKTFFINTVGHVKGRAGPPIERTTIFSLNPLVNVQTLLVAVGDGNGFQVQTESIVASQVNWRSFILYSGLWLLAMGGFHWFMGDGPFRIKSLRLPEDPRHPAWLAIKITLAGIVLTTILAFNASSFDSTEVVSIGTFVLAALGIDGVHLARLKKLTGGS